MLVVVSLPPLTIGRSPAAVLWSCEHFCSPVLQVLYTFVCGVHISVSNFAELCFCALVLGFELKTVEIIFS